MSNPPEFFWSPPRLGEQIKGMIQYHDLIVIATNEGVYIIRDKDGGGLDNHVVDSLPL